MADKNMITTGHKSIKHEIIDKANSSMLIAVSGAVFVVVFCLFAGKSLISQSSYQSKIIKGKEEALKITDQSLLDAEKLQQSYIAFATEPINILGGSPDGDGPKSGDNAEIILDSLPYELDFPALSSSVEKILLDGGYTIQSIGGDDSTFGDQGVTREGDALPGSSTPAPIDFPFAVNAAPESALNLLQVLERSIRPFEITTLRLEGRGDSLEVNIGMKTYYKPAVSLQVTERTVE